ncbi:hypothetical protein ABIE20_001047 [Pseudomonas sp. 2835]
MQPIAGKAGSHRYCAPQKARHKKGHPKVAQKN